MGLAVGRDPGTVIVKIDPAKFNDSAYLGRLAKAIAADEGVLLQIRRAAKKAGVAVDVEALRELAESYRGQFADVSALEGAPIEYRPVIPPGWSVTLKGVVAVPLDDREGSIAAHSPVVVVSRSVDMEAQTEGLTLAWLDRGRWRTLTAPRSVILTARSVTALCDRGLPVSSATCTIFVRYVDAYLAANDVPVAYYLRRLGWVGTDFAPYYLPSGIRIEAPTGSEGLIAGCHSRGDKSRADGWLTDILRHSAAVWTLAASLASPVLPLLGADGFVWSLAGPTSNGKTTVLEAAAALWGKPHAGAQDALVSTWDTTAVGAERMFGLLCHLPAMLDDTKRSRRAGEIEAIVYAATQGRGRTRGSVGARTVQAMDTWQLVLLSTGEDRIAATTAAGGLRARILEHWGAVLPGADGDTVRGIRREVRDHYGWHGPAWIAALARPATVPQIRVWRDIYRGQLPVGGEVSDRLREHAALLCAVLHLAIHASILPCNASLVAEAIPALAAILAAAGEAARPGERALSDVVSWVVSCHDQLASHGNRAPSDGWLGTYRGDVLSLYPHRLRSYLESAGYTYESVLAEWRDSGVLDAEFERATTKIMIEGQRARMICIRVPGLAFS